MKAIFVVTGLALIVIGVVWWWNDHPSAERPASLLVIMGVMCAATSWWVP